MAKKKSSVVKSQRGHNETTNVHANATNVVVMPESDKPVDPFEDTAAPARDTEGDDVVRRDFSGESGSGKG